MKYVWTTIMTDDLDKSIYFYAEIIGLKLNRRFIGGPGTEIAFLGEGDTQIELITDGTIRGSNREVSITLGFKTESIDEAMKMFTEKNVPFHSKVFQPNPNLKFFFTADPNGVCVQICEEI